MSIKALISVAEQEIGYLEKASIKNLDSKTANAGSGNYTKYWRDLKPSYQGEPWCNAFTNWDFYKVYGKTTAKKLLCCNDFDYYTPTTAGYFKDAKRWFSTPKVGDLVYFKNSTRIHHIGLVVGVTVDYITTVEGNTSTANKVVANGGGVWSKTYKRTNSAIAGYGRPDYAALPKPFVEQLYSKALGRMGAASEIAYWANNLASGASTGTSVAKAFYLGKEYENRKRSNSEYLNDLYAGLFGRTPDASGYKYWLGLLNEDRRTRSDVLKGFTISAEFINTCTKCGIDKGKW